MVETTVKKIKRKRKFQIFRLVYKIKQKKC